MAEGKIPKGHDAESWAFTTEEPTPLSSEWYTSFPTDGYLLVTATTEMTLYFSGYNYQKILDTVIPAGQKWMCFVKKGMVAKIASGTGYTRYFKMTHN